MKFFKNVLLLFTLGVLVFASCDKDDDPVDEKVFDYHVHIHSPNLDDKHVNDTIQINVEFESMKIQPVHHINIRIYNKSDNTEVYNKPDVAHIHETDGRFEYQHDFVLSNANGVMEHTDWVLEAKVWGDSPGLEEESASVEFHVHP